MTRWRPSALTAGNRTPVTKGAPVEHRTSLATFRTLALRVGTTAGRTATTVARGVTGRIAERRATRSSTPPGAVPRTPGATPAQPCRSPGRRPGVRPPRPPTWRAPWPATPPGSSRTNAGRAAAAGAAPERPGRQAAGPRRSRHRRRLGLTPAPVRVARRAPHPHLTEIATAQAERRPGSTRPPRRSSAARISDTGQRPTRAYFSSALLSPSTRRATISCWICWVPSKMSRILESRDHFSSSSASE